VNLLEAHLICLGLVATDVLTRIWRIQWIMQGLKQHLTLKDAFILNTFGDAANSLTPLRIGGEPARLAWMLRSRLPMTAALLGITLEALVSRFVLVAVVIWLAWQFATGWWVSVGPRLRADAAAAWPWLILVLLAGVLLWLYTQRIVSPITRRMRRSLARVLVYWRRMPRWPLVVGIPLSLLSIVSRVAILPVLALSLASPPPFDLTTFGSFTLLYSQMVLPTPAGAGVVELGFMGGAAGEFQNDGWLLLAWRFYTTGLSVLLGVWFAARFYGWPTLRKVMRPSTVDVRETASR
jgi:uncharacterized protein (TIRG00374 family)